MLLQFFDLVFINFTFFFVLSKAKVRKAKLEDSYKLQKFLAEERFQSLFILENKCPCSS